MDIARDICTDSFYIVNSGLPCIPVTAVICNVDNFDNNFGDNFDNKFDENFENVMKMHLFCSILSAMLTALPSP